MSLPIAIGKIVREFYHYDHFFIKSQFSISNDFNKIVIFLESKNVGLVEEVNNVKFYHSPFGKSCPKKKLAIWIAEIFVKENVKIIHCDQHSATSVGIAAKKIAKIPYLFSHVHGNNICRGIPRKLFYWWNKKHITKLIACADWVKKDILATYPTYKENNVVTIANGVDIKKFNPQLISAQTTNDIRQEIGVKNDEMMFLSTCRLSPDKNLTLLFSAFARVFKDYNNIKLFVAGEGRLRPQLEEIIRNLKMEQHIKLLGFRTDVKELLATCNCFILPSRREGFGLSPVEAAAMGKTVIFSDTGIGYELLGDISPNFLLRVDNEEDIEKALRDFMQLSENEQNENGQKLLNKVKNNFSHELMVQKTENLYRKTLGI